MTYEIVVVVEADLIHFIAHRTVPMIVPLTQT